MADFEKEETTVRKFPQIKDNFKLTEGQTLKDIPELMSFADKSIPEGKEAEILVYIKVRSLKNAQVEQS
ncbi:unnamed protein product [marine sediment metagenome]|uniref:Uncharacterized protein n=1 Tax=marine sediment metagenome TaxID=412755 RepID=X0ZFX4_9ZZZZ